MKWGAIYIRSGTRHPTRMTVQEGRMKEQGQDGQEVDNPTNSSRNKLNIV